MPIFQLELLYWPLSLLSRGKLLVHSSFSRAQSKFDVLQSWFKCELLKYKRSNLKLKKFYHWVTIRHTTT